MAHQRQANFGYLLIGLLVILIAGPVFNDFTNQSLTVITQVAFTTTLIIGIWSLTGSRRWFMIGMAMVAVEIASTIISLLRPSVLIGGICVYLLLGVSIAILNVLIFRFIPHSFSGLPDASDPSNSMNLIYYSFVTMTTLGFGDITPDGSLARVLAYLAAITGQFYIAILVGTLVGMYLSQRNDDDEQPRD